MFTLPSTSKDTNKQEFFMKIALELGKEALEAQEVPIGCIFVYKEFMLAKSRNTVNETKNAIRHAELNCIDQIYEFFKQKLSANDEINDAPKVENVEYNEISKTLKLENMEYDQINQISKIENRKYDQINEILKVENKKMDPKVENIQYKNFNEIYKANESLLRDKDNSSVSKKERDFLYDKEIDLTNVFLDRNASILNKFNTPDDIFKAIDVYVTVEPCIMCLTALIELGVNSITYGCENDRFGGKTVLDVQQVLLKSVNMSGGIFKDQAMGLLKNFYMGVNPNAPKSIVKVKGKKGRTKH